MWEPLTARHWTLPCGSRKRSSKFASTATPAGWLIRCANNGCPCRVAVRDLCVAYSVAEHNQLRYVGHNSEVATPKSFQLYRGTDPVDLQSPSDWRSVVARRDNWAEYGFYLGQGNVPCSGSVLVCRTRSKK